VIHQVSKAAQAVKRRNEKTVRIMEEVVGWCGREAREEGAC
jgi:hypothetical protein